MKNKNIFRDTCYHVSLTCADSDGDMQDLDNFILSEDEYNSLTISIKKFKYLDEEWKAVYGKA